MRVQKVVSTDGYRVHELSEDCWCKPTLDEGVIVHRCQCSWQRDSQPRMTVYGDALAQS